MNYHCPTVSDRKRMPKVVCEHGHKKWCRPAFVKKDIFFHTYLKKRSSSIGCRTIICQDGFWWSVKHLTDSVSGLLLSQYLSFTFPLSLSLSLFLSISLSFSLRLLTFGTGTPGLFRFISSHYAGLLFVGQGTQGLNSIPHCLFLPVWVTALWHCSTP